MISSFPQGPGAFDQPYKLAISTSRHITTLCHGWYSDMEALCMPQDVSYRQYEG